MWYFLCVWKREYCGNSEKEVNENLSMIVMKPKLVPRNQSFWAQLPHISYRFLFILYFSCHDVNEAWHHHWKRNMNRLLPPYLHMEILHCLCILLHKYVLVPIYFCKKLFCIYFRKKVNILGRKTICQNGIGLFCYDGFVHPKK